MKVGLGPERWGHREYLVFLGFETLFVERAISYLSQILPRFGGGGNLRKVQYVEMVHIAM